MQAILKAKHQRFCKMIQDIKTIQSEPDDKLSELEMEFHFVYEDYKQRIGDIKQILEEYQQKQKALRSRMRQLLGGKKVAVSSTADQ